MSHPSIEMLFFLIGAGFVAAFIDSVVGGGGLITLPALLFAGLPPGIALGTNKLASTMSSITSTSSFLLAGKIDFRLVRWLFPLSFAGAIGGTYLVKQIPSEFLRPLVAILLVVITIYSLLKKNWGVSSTFTSLQGLKAVGIGIGAMVIGFYDGFFGPGTGSFLIFMFLMVGLDFVGASANSKVLNLASNMASLITFFLLNSVNIYYGLSMGIAMIAGALVGSQVAIRKGAAYVKPLFIIVTALLISKQLWNVLS
jgi:uncharacterized membrane protein YfcA